MGEFEYTKLQGNSEKIQNDSREYSFSKVGSWTFEIFIFAVLKFLNLEFWESLNPGILETLKLWELGI